MEVQLYEVGEVLLWIASGDYGWRNLLLVVVGGVDTVDIVPKDGSNGSWDVHNGRIKLCSAFKLQDASFGAPELAVIYPQLIHP